MFDWEQAPPAEWERRLREISPITDQMAHLRFRWRSPQPHWFHPDEGQWELYACTPRQMVTPDRAAQFAKHWADLPKSQQAGRKAFVTTYQYHMWHRHGVDAHRFWVLQGPAGGTPAIYTEREQAILRSIDQPTEAPPFGLLPACDFDELAVRNILIRDRFLRYQKDADALRKANSVLAQVTETEEAERLFRERFLDEWYARMRPQAEFLQSYLRTSEADMTMRKATREETDAAAQWKDHFKEYGSVPNAGVAGSRKVQVAVR